MKPSLGKHFRGQLLPMYYLRIGEGESVRIRVRVRVRVKVRVRVRIRVDVRGVPYVGNSENTHTDRHSKKQRAYAKTTRPPNHTPPTPNLT